MSYGQACATTVSDSQAIDIQAIAAVVQAFAAAIVAVLTWRLIVATNAYVATTREQVKASQEQLAELREARAAAAARPRIYPLGVGHSDGPGGLQMVQLRLINLGGGPAIDLTPMDDGLFSSDPPRAHLAEHDNMLFTFTPRASVMDYHNTFVVAYGDINDDRWVTRVEVDLTVQCAGGGVTSVLTERA